MKKTIQLSFILLTMMGLMNSVMAQKKTQNLKVSREFNLPAKKIWQIVGEDYGAIANSHPRIISSNYINGALEAKEGAERVCNFNDKGTQYLKEKMTDYNPENMSFTNQVYQAGKFPLDPDVTRALYQVEDLGNGKSKLTFDFDYRTKPAFMGAMAKGKFKKLLQDYFIAIEHHARTGESVTKENFKAIKKKYRT